MKQKQKVWIHCRVSTIHERGLLIYQEEALKKIAEKYDLLLFGITREISKGINPNSNELHALKVLIKRKDIDYVLVYDKTRILIFEDLFEEFAMYCESFGVRILSLKDLETF